MEIQIRVAMILNKTLGGFKSPSSNKHVLADSFRVRHHDNFEWNHYWRTIPPSAASHSLASAALLPFGKRCGLHL